MVGASSGVFGAVWAQAELRKTLAATGARVLEAELPVGQAATRFVGDRLVDEEVREELQRIVEQLAREARVTQQVRTGTSAAAAAA